MFSEVVESYEFKRLKLGQYDKYLDGCIHLVDQEIAKKINCVARRKGLQLLI